jgi:hypothetical protein
MTDADASARYVAPRTVGKVPFAWRPVTPIELDESVRTRAALCGTRRSAASTRLRHADAGAACHASTNLMGRSA